jgi:filamentous hemagglutinin family protein
MIVSLFFWRLLLKSIWLTGMGITLTESFFPALAQLIPDSPLGSQSSTVNTSGLVDTIRGGVKSGANLFHSFLELNVGSGRSLYFSDPGVSNILTRVTGNNPSKIDGRLGVSGSANLFLINPNGIIFGSGSSLDIRGSFTATTAAAIKFADGSEFSATNPASSNLLTISIPIGLQRGANQSTGTIINRGNLQTGQDLTLEADRLDLQGQLQAGRNLTLQATDTVLIRDTPVKPFLAQASGNLVIQGDRGIDILALNHPTQTPLQSSGNLTLISDGVISGDARFASKGNFQVRSRSGGLANFTSLYDPIITSIGDVDLALNYTGASLLIEAGGNIRIQGTVDITAPDVAAPFVGDDIVLNAQPGLIARSGQTTLRYAGNSGIVPGSNAGVGFVLAPGITLQGAVNIAPDGVVRLTANGNGSINTQEILAPRGAIALTSAQSITTNGQSINVGTDSGDAGSIRLTTLNGNLSTGDLVANVESFTGDVGNGGAVSLASINGSITTGQVQMGAYSFTTSGNGGTLTLSATNGNIVTGDVFSNSYGAFGGIGNGGKVNISSSDGSIRTGNIDVSLLGDTSTVQGGEITIASTNGAISTGTLIAISQSQYGISGDGGKIAVLSTRGHITTGDLTVGSEGGSGSRNSGEITVAAGNGNITTGSLSANSFGYLNNESGNGGTIALSSRNGSVITKALSTRSLSSYLNTGNAGSITITAGGDIQTGTVSNYALALAFGILNVPPNFDRSIPLLRTGKGGATTLTSTRGSIQTGDLFSFSTASPESTIFPRSITDFEQVKQAVRLAGHDLGGDIRLSAAQNITTGLISTISSDGSGAIALSAGNTINATGTIISSDTFGVGKAGNSTLSAQSVLLKDGAQLSASTHGAGNGGNIAISVKDGLELGGIASHPPTTTLSIQTPVGLAVIPDVYLGGYLPTGDVNNISTNGAFPSGVFVQSTQGSTGNAGNINIQAGQLTLRDQGTIAATTFGSGTWGNVSVNAGAILADNGSIFSGVAPGSVGTSGAIAVSAQSLNLVNQGRIQALTLGSGRAGDINIQTETTAIAGNLSGIISGSGTPDLRSGNSGNGGNIQLVTRALQVKDEGIISASTFTNGQGGNINVTATEVELSSQGKLSATTQDRGNAGNITMNASDRVLISGDRSGIFANSTPQAIGNGGSVFLASDQLLLQDKGRITVGTQGQGQGGDIQVFANQINLDSQSLITAETSGNGKAATST